MPDANLHSSRLEPLNHLGGIEFALHCVFSDQEQLHLHQWPLLSCRVALRTYLSQPDSKILTYDQIENRSYLGTEIALVQEEMW